MKWLGTESNKLEFLFCWGTDIVVYMKWSVIIWNSPAVNWYVDNLIEYLPVLFDLQNKGWYNFCHCVACASNISNFTYPSERTNNLNEIRFVLLWASLATAISERRQHCVFLVVPSASSSPVAGSACFQKTGIQLLDQ